MKKRLLITLGALVVALALCVGVARLMGSRLPPDHVATVRAHFRAPPDSLYAAVSDVAAYPKWRADVKRVELLPAHHGHTAWRETTGSGALDYEFTLAIPTNRLVSTLVSTGAGFTGRWMYHFLPDTVGTTVILTEEGLVQEPLFRFAMHYVIGEHSSQEQFLGMLARRFGETVRTERLP